MSKQNRKKTQSVVDFLRSPRAEGTKWWVDPDTNEVVAQCELCLVEARHTKDDLVDFRFDHAAGCPSLGRSGDLTVRDVQGYDLVDSFINAICEAEQETDIQTDGVLSALAFVAAGVCTTSHRPTVEEFDYAVASLRRHVQVLHGVDLSLRGPSDGEKPDDHPAMETGERAGQEIVEALRHEDGSVALIAAQYALAEIILKCCPTDAMRVARQCNTAVRDRVSDRTPLPGLGV